ncbi:hypothetical protein [Paraburkholderia aspalathi]|uniref:hypothetical protein n=1 Tax=Paraburkholderia aspalathi TaxID=1324617 RepID=UPI0038BB7284
MTKKEISGLIENVKALLPRFCTTYKWAAVLSDKRISGTDNVRRLRWWQFMLVSSAILVASTVAGFVAALHMNPLAMYSREAGDAADVMSQLSQTAQNVADEIQSATLGEAAFVFLGSIVTSVLGAYLIAAAHAFSGRDKAKRLEKINQSTFVISIVLVKFSLCWLLATVIAFLFRIAGFEVYFRRHDQAALVIIVLFALGSAYVWVWYERRRTFRLAAPVPKPAFAAGILAIGVLGAELWLAVAAGNLGKPSIRLTLSQQCDREACFAYLTGKNVEKSILDSTLRFQVKMNYLGSPPGHIESTHGYLDLQLAPTTASPGVVPIDPTTKQTVAIRNVHFFCPGGIVQTRQLAPVEANGTAILQLLKSRPGEDSAFVDTEIKGVLMPLFRLADGKCPKT